MATCGAKTTSEAKRLNFFHIRNWHGMPLGVWLRALRIARFAVSPSCGLQALRMTMYSTFNSALHWADRLVYDRAVARAPLPQPPLFIVGHWRTGTTLLHELMVRDEQFSYPNTYQVMVPQHFLLTERFIPALMNHALPSRRPMDNVEVGFDKPQEDEFALCNMGLPSPYLRWGFPNTTAGDRALDLNDLTEAERREWTAGMTRFIRRLACRDQRRQVLKSPTHTARVGHLAAAFPGAQFIHIVRDPRAVFASTVHTWKQIWSSVAFQEPNFADIEEFVLSTFERMYRAFERDRPSLGPRQLHEINYEDLIRDPVGEIKKIYDQLGLKGFDRARQQLEDYASKSKSFRPNKHDLPAELWNCISKRWRGYIERYGYDTHPGGTP